MSIGSLFKISQGEREKFSSHLIESSSPRIDFYFLVILSTLIVSLGLMSDNLVLVIGGMLVTPLLSPILAIALGIVINHPKVIIRSIRIFLMAFVFAFVVAFIVGVFIERNVGDVQLIQVMKPSLFTLFIAVIAGLAASYTWVKPNVNETLPGIAITVTLIPPLTAVGLAVAGQNWHIAIDVLKVLLLNVFGIVVTSLVVFSLMDFYKVKKVVEKEIKAEEKEKAKAKKAGVMSELDKVEKEKQEKIQQIEKEHKNKIKKAKAKIKKEREKIAIDKKMLGVEKEDIKCAKGEDCKDIKWKD